MKDVIIINPPMVQLNTPYPSGAYLGSFFKSQGCNTRWYDLNIDLFYSIFSSSCLKKLFELTEKKALKMAEKAENQDAAGNQSENGWRPVVGGLLVAECRVGCRIDPRAKHRASRKPFQVGVGHIRLLGEVQLASPRKAICH